MTKVIKLMIINIIHSSRLMARIIILAALCLCMNASHAQIASMNSQSPPIQPKLSPSDFVENKGQIGFGNFASGEILFYSHQKNKRYYFRKGGFSIEHYTIEKEDSTGRFQYNFERTDFEFENFNENVQITGTRTHHQSFNFYNEKGAFEDVKSFKQINYKEIHPNIDIRFYIINGELKYDVVLKKGCELARFKVNVKGNIPLIGESKIKYSSSLFNFSEEITRSYYYNSGAINECAIKFKETAENQFGFTIQSNYEFDSLIIDPEFKHTRKIATYYGDDDEDRSFDVTTDKHNRIYTAGRTNSSSFPMSSSSVHQGSLGGAQDAFVAKFDPKLKTLMWSTFYGGDDEDEAYGVTVSSNKDIFIAGYTKCTTAIATTGAHQTSYGGNVDGFIAKFDSTGKRQFGTYYGGDKEDVINSIYTDSKNLFVTGHTSSDNGTLLKKIIATTHQTKYGGGGESDAFIVKLNLNGRRQWGTYYGDDDEEIGYAVTVDDDENVYATGLTRSDKAISTISGNSRDSRDAFVVKFNKGGTRQWGRYFGGDRDDYGYGIDVTKSQLVITGKTESKKNLTKGFSMSLAGDFDVFVASIKKNNGSVEWARYYGGSADEVGEDICIDRNENILVTGSTESDNGIATKNSYQTARGSGSIDAFLVKFDDDGKTLWTTYFGEKADDEAKGVFSDTKGNMIVAGLTRSTNSIATGGTFDSTFNQADDAFIAKFCDIIITRQPKDQTVWLGGRAVFRVKQIGSDVGKWKYQWYKDGKPVSGETKRNIVINPADSSDEGYYLLKIQNDCGVLWTDSAKLTILKYTPPPTICEGETATITLDQVSGATYSWSPSTGLNKTNASTVKASPTSTTKYTAIIKTSSSTDTVEITVTVKPLPGADAGNDIEICSGTTGQIGYSGCTSCTYSWSPTKGLSSPNSSSTSVTRKALFNKKTDYDYTLTVTKNGCESKDDVTVTVLPLPSVNAGRNFEKCLNDAQFTLSGSTPTGGTWFGKGVSSGSFSPGTAGVGTHKIGYTYTDNNGCSDTDFVDIIVNDLPEVDGGPDRQFCNTINSATLKAVKPKSGGTWKGDYVSSTGVFNPKSAGVGKHAVYYTYKDNNGCENEDTVVVTIVKIIIADAGKDASMCIDAGKYTIPNFSPSGGGWSGKGITDTTKGEFDPKIAGVGTHKLTYTIGSGSCKSTDDITITIYGLPTVSAGNDQSMCISASAVTLSGTPSGGTWTGKGVNSGKFDPKIAGAGTHKLTYTYKDNNNCENSDDANFTVYALPTVSAGTDRTVCHIAGKITLSPSPSGGSWRGNSNISGNSFDVSKAGVGTYELIYSVTDNNNCQNEDTVEIKVINPQNVNAGKDFSICVDASSVSLSGTPSSGTWSGKGVSGSSFNPGNAGAGKHEIIYTFGSGTCQNYDTLEATVFALPTVDAGSNKSVCISDNSWTLSGSPSGGKWTGTGVTSGSFDPSTAGAGTFKLTYTYKDANGCENSDDVSITVNKLPTVSAGNDSIVCHIIGTIRLKGSPSGGTWSGNSNISGTSFNVKNAGVGSYDLIYTYKDNNGCENSDTATIKVVNPQTVSAGTDIELCVNDNSISLSGSPSGGTWTGNGISGSSFSPSSAGTGTHDLVYSVGSGTCTNYDTLEAIVNGLPSVSAGFDFETCIDDTTYSLNGSPSLGRWIGKAIDTIKNTFNPSKAGKGKYALIYIFKDSKGCSDTDDVEAIVYDLPVVNAGKDTVVCAGGGNVTLKGNVNGYWSGSHVSSQGVFDANAASVGSYNIVLYYLDSKTDCDNTDTLVVKVIKPQNVFAGKNDTFCVNDKDILLTGSPSGGRWKGTGIKGNYFSPSSASAGLHEVYYEIGSGTCINTDTIEMLVNALPTVKVSPTSGFCESDSMAQMKNYSPANGTWRGTGIIDSVKGIFSPIKMGSGDFDVTYHVEDRFGCKNSDTLNIRVHQLPNVSAGDDSTICDQPVTLYLKGSPKGSTGYWSGDHTSSSGEFVPDGTGTFNIVYTYTDSNFCLNRDTVEVIVVNPTPVSAGKDTQVCYGNGPFQLTGLPTGGKWSGDNITSKGQFSPLKTGRNTLVYSKGYGSCQTFDTVFWVVHPRPVIDAGDKVSICVDADTLTINNNYTPAGGSFRGAGIVDSLNGQFLPSIHGVGSSYLKYFYRDTSTTCRSIDSFKVIVNGLPKIDAGQDTAICNQPIPITLKVDSQGGFWSKNGIDKSGEFTPKDTGIFNVRYTYTDRNGCVSSDSLDITVKDPIVAIAGSSFEICIFDSITLKGSPNIGTWGGYATTTNGLFKPTKAGTFTLTYSIGSGNCLTTDSLFAKVNPLPNVSVTGPKIICTNDPPYTFQKSASPSGGYFSSSVNIDSTSGLFNPRLIGLGNYKVAYNYTDPKTGCFNTDTHSIKVSGLPKLSLNLDTILCVNTQINFTNNSSTQNTYVWNFGDGSGNKNGLNQSHTYKDTGNYTVSVIGVTVDGCKDTFKTDFIVVAPPEAKFDIDPMKGCGPLWVNIFDKSFGRFTSYKWVLETGDTLLGKRDSIQFFPDPYDSITYDMTLELTNVCKTSYHTDSVKVYPKPTANVHIEPKVGCTPLPVTFKNRSYGIPDSFIYEFGDGRIVKKVDTFFENTYYTDSTLSIYRFRFWAMNECGIDSQITEIQVKPNYLKAFFELDTSQGCTPFDVRAIDYHRGGATVTWEVEGFGKFSDDTLYHQISDSGNYIVSQYLDNGCARDTFSTPVYVRNSPIPKLSYYDSLNCVNDKFRFVNGSKPISGQNWFIDSVLVGDKQELIWQFGKLDTYRVTLKVFGNDEFKCESSLSKKVIPRKLPDLNISVGDTFGCKPFNFKSKVKSESAIFYKWVADVNNGFNYLGDSINVNYNDSGKYHGYLVGEDIYNCKDTVPFYVRVYAKPEADFVTDDSLYCGTPSIAAFTNLSKYGGIHKWSFGNGEISRDANPKVEFEDYGLFENQLITQNIYGCADTITKPIELIRYPVIDYDLEPLEGCQPLQVCVFDTSKNITHYTWTLNGVTKNGRTPCFTLDTVGDFPLRMIASNRQKCFDSVVNQSIVTVYPKPWARFVFEEIPDPKAHGKFAFESKTPNMDMYKWHFDDGDTGYGLLDTHRYSVNMTYTVKHVVRNEFGCLDTIEKKVTPDFFYGLYIPNAMSLVHENGKQYTRFIPKGQGLAKFELEIYTTWGELVYRTNSLVDGIPDGEWDGTHYKNGKVLDEDAYVWKVHAEFQNGVIWPGMETDGGFTRVGTITIIR